MRLARASAAAALVLAAAACTLISGVGDLSIDDGAHGVCTNARALLDDPNGGTRYLTPASAGLACSAGTIGGARRTTPASASMPYVAAAAAVLALRRRRRRACSSSQ